MPVIIECSRCINTYSSAKFEYKTKIGGGYDVFHIGICDDGKEVCAELEDMIYKLGKKHGVGLETSVWFSGESLCDFLKRENTLDMLFLDIDLITTDGIQVGNFIREKMKNLELIIIYISSKSSYAMRLFEVQPIGFLIKPLKTETVENVFLKSIHFYELKNQKFEYYSKGYFYKISFREMCQFNGKLKEIASELPHNFIMIHQSYIINLDYMVECSYEAIRMQGDNLLSISIPYRKLVREQIMKYKWEEK